LCELNSYHHNDDFTFELSHSFEEFFLVAVESALDNNRRESAARNEEGMVVFGRIVGRCRSFGRLGHVGIRQLRLYCSMLLFLFIIQLSSHLLIFFFFLSCPVYDAFQQGPEVISLTMTPVLIIYSTLFARWSMVIQPKNMFLAACHVTNVLAQGNQLRRALEYKMQSGQEAEVQQMLQQAGIGGAALAGAVLIGPTLRSVLSNAKSLGVVATIAAADAGPFTVHFWAPMSKWMISGASFFDLNRPTEKISLAQYSALTLTGFFFSRYSLLVIPINYVLCSVNIALFGSSAWHLGRKINADYLHIGMEPKSAEEPKLQ
jgi:Mitochondrial pyruvate carriers